MDIGTAADLASVIGVVGGLVSIWIALRGVRDERAWNRRKNAEDTLTRLVNEDFGDLIIKIEDDFGWNIINDPEDYDATVKEMEPAEQKMLDRQIRRMLRILESMCIYIKHDIIADEMVFDYMASIGPIIADKCSVFIKNERDMRNNPRIFTNFASAVERWQSMA
ncbi:MAG: DUF4760 domain-containing protein [Chloroflexota bacterium]